MCEIRRCELGEHLRPYSCQLPGRRDAGPADPDRGVPVQHQFAGAGALLHPNIVVAHWFQFRDQPLTGRLDGEGVQTGFVDIADTPYREMTEISGEIGENMYRCRINGKYINDMKGK